MAKVNKVNVFALGDSDEISTWSNVPYFFVQSLQARGIAVNRVNINRSLFGKVLNRTAWRLIRLTQRETTYDYFRSAFHFDNVRRKIGRVLRRHHDADANIFLTFSFSSAGLTDKPTVLFCDWTYDHQLKHFSNKTPDPLERASVEREDQQIEGADLVFVLFPRVADYMHGRYRNKNIHYIGNVINARQAPSDTVLQTKLVSRNILFVGGPKYLEGARALVEAFRALRASDSSLRLDIVGIKAREIGNLPPGAKCHGYLDKGHAPDRDRYYSLLNGARMIVNTTPKWGAFSATLEAMHFYTPVITSPYDEFVETFGQRIAFGRYCIGPTTDELCVHIQSLLEDEGYEALCRQAHDVVRDYSWDAYVAKIVAKIEALSEEELVLRRQQTAHEPSLGAPSG